MVSIARTTKRLLAIGTLVLGVLTLTPVAAGAQNGCGEYSYGFAGTRLLNDGISDSAGPFTIDLPAGTYDVQPARPAPDRRTMVRRTRRRLDLAAHPRPRGRTRP